MALDQKRFNDFFIKNPVIYAGGSEITGLKKERMNLSDFKVS
jgi:phage antirepressor YoqD-like protein